jgi:hypothetical protein
MDAPSNGNYSKTLENGVQMSMTIENGKLVHYEAKDENGKTLKTFELKMSGPEDEVCFYCVTFDGNMPNDYGDNQMCFQGPCSFGPHPI